MNVRSWMASEFEVACAGASPSAGAGPGSTWFEIEDTAAEQVETGRTRIR